MNKGINMNYKDIVLEIKKQVINSMISEDIVMKLSNNNNLSYMDFSLLCEELNHDNINIVCEDEYKKLLENRTSADNETKLNAAKLHINDAITEIIELFLQLSKDEKLNCFKKLSVLIEQEKTINSTIDDQEADNTIKNDFIIKFQAKSLQYSYIAVLIKALLSNVNPNGQVSLEKVIDYFREFYDDRRRKGLVVEQEDSIFYKANYTRCDIRRIILFNPVKRSFLANYVTFNKSTNMLIFNSLLWDKLTQIDKKKINEIANDKLTAYYNRIS